MPADMKEQIANAAMTLIVQKNVRKLTVKQIVEECHITRQTFYYHFEDIPHLLQWILVRGLKQMRESARDQGGIEERLRYMFSIAVQAKPYVRKTMASNYGEEMERILRKEMHQLAEDVAEESHQFQNIPREEMKIVMQYHTQALMGMLEQWSDASSEQIDQVVHTIYKIMSGKIALTDNIV